jgi:hypothetical protein
MQMQRQIITVTDKMFPKPALPDAFFTTAPVAGRDMIGRRHMARERRFQQTPPLGIVRAIIRQRPDHMKFVRQNNSRVNAERPTMPRQPSGIAQHIDVADQKIRLLVLQPRSKEIRATRHPEACVIGHLPRLGQQS